MTEPRFIHLRLHSAYSLLEGAVPVKKLPDLCAAAGMPAVALTDTGNLFARARILRGRRQGRRRRSSRSSAASSPSPSPTPAHPGDRPPAPRPVVLLAQDEAGFGNLMQLSSLNYLGCGAAEPHVTLAALEAHAAGLICLTGGADGPLGALLADGHAPRARGAGRAPRRDLPRPALRRGPAPPGRRRAAHARRGGDRARPRRPRLRPRPAAGRHQRRALPDPRPLRRPRRAALHRRRRLRRPAGAAPPADPRALLQVAGRDGRAVRRPARGGREHRRDRPPLRLPPEEAQADPAALRRRRGRGAAPPGPRRPRRPPRGDPALAPRSRPTASGSSSSSASSRAWASPATS